HANQRNLLRPAPGLCRRGGDTLMNLLHLVTNLLCAHKKSYHALLSLFDNPCLQKEGLPGPTSESLPSSRATVQEQKKRQPRRNQPLAKEDTGGSGQRVRESMAPRRTSYLPAPQLHYPLSTRS